MVTVAATKDPVTTMGGVTILPDMTVDELRPDDSAMLILAGADTWLTGGNTEFAAKARQFLDAGRPGGRDLRSDRSGSPPPGCSTTAATRATLPVFVEAMGSKGGDLYVDEPAVTDRGLITGNGDGAGRVRPRDLRPARPLRTRGPGLVVQALRAAGSGRATSS